MRISPAHLNLGCSCLLCGAYHAGNVGLSDGCGTAGHFNLSPRPRSCATVGDGRPMTVRVRLAPTSVDANRQFG